MTKKFGSWCLGDWVLFRLIRAIRLIRSIFSLALRASNVVPIEE
jgi:hypothetical protein